MLIWDDELWELHKRYRKILDHNEEVSGRIQRGIREFVDECQNLIESYRACADAEERFAGKLKKFTQNDRSKWAESVSSSHIVNERHSKTLRDLSDRLEKEFVEPLDEFCSYEFKLQRLLLNELANKEKDYSLLRGYLLAAKKRGKLKGNDQRKYSELQMTCQNAEEGLIRRRSEIMIMYDDMRKRKLSYCLEPFVSLVSSYMDYFSGGKDIALIVSDYYMHTQKLLSHAQEQIKYPGRCSGYMKYFENNKWKKYWFKLGSRKKLHYIKGKKSTSRVYLGNFAPSDIADLQINTRNVVDHNDIPTICITHASIDGLFQFRCLTFAEHKQWVNAFIEDAPPVIASIESLNGVEGDEDVGYSPPLIDLSRYVAGNGSPSKSRLRNLSFTKLHEQYDVEFKEVLDSIVDDPVIFLRSILGNEHCADCYSIAPHCAIPKYGIITCEKCSRCHGYELILNLDGSWNPILLELMGGLGNEVVNSILEANIPAGQLRPHHNASETQRSSWIRDKYTKKAMMADPMPEGEEELNNATQEYYTRLLEACRVCDLKEMLKSLLRISPNSVVKTDIEEPFSFPIAAAVSGKHAAAVQLLLLWGTNVNMAHTVTGNTALHYSGIAGSKDIYNLLVRNGADTEIENGEGRKAKDLFPM